MKTLKTITLILIICLLLVFITACTKASDKKVAEAKTGVNEATQDVKNTADQTATAVQTDWEKFKAESEAKIADNERIIANYKVKMTNATGKMKANYDKKIEVLEQKNKELKAKLEAYKDDGKDSWKKFKTDFDKDMDNLGNSLKNFVDKD